MILPGLARICKEDVPHSGISIGAHVRVISLNDVAVHQHGAELRD
jgi:hypothetical protein